MGEKVGLKDVQRVVLIERGSERKKQRWERKREREGARVFSM